MGRELMASRITRREFGSGHVYSLDGRRCPGVTTIIRNSSPSTGLLKWYGREAAEWALTHMDARETLGDKEWVNACARAAEDTRDKSAERGRAIHAAAEALADGKPIEVPEEIATPARSIIEFLTVWEARVLARECVVFHTGHRYAGQFDVIAELKDGARWLIDYKTGKGVYPDVALQLAAYRNAEYIVWNDEDRKMPAIDKTGVLHVTENDWELVPVDTGPEVWAAFLNAIPLYRFHGTKYGYDRIGESLPRPDAPAVATVTPIREDA